MHTGPPHQSSLATRTNDSPGVSEMLSNSNAPAPAPSALRAKPSPSDVTTLLFAIHPRSADNMNGRLKPCALLNTIVVGSTTSAVTWFAMRAPRVRPSFCRSMLAAMSAVVNGSPLPNVTSSRMVTVHDELSSFGSHDVAM